jgi:hypothetical protein
MNPRSTISFHTIYGIGASSTNLLAGSPEGSGAFLSTWKIYV